MRKFVGAAAAAAVAFTNPAFAAGGNDGEDKSSRYLRCDGKPNNMTDGESFARFLGAITLLALFAPTPEAPDPEKRRFGAEGVSACTALIDGDKAEGNGLRRIPLILARAAHSIEAKDYDAALADVEKARSEATALGLVGNPYFDRSMGLAFGSLEAAARVRKGDAEGARTAGLGVLRDRYGLLTLATAQSYPEMLPQMSGEEEKYLRAVAAIFGPLIYPARLEEVGRFADAARERTAYLAFSDPINPDKVQSILSAQAALSHALAGDFARARELAKKAQDNLAARRAAGTPEDDAPQTVEILDLTAIVIDFAEGKQVEARRRFAARSEWLAASFGAVLETTRRLREGAEPEDLTGALARSADELWADRRDRALALMLEKDTNNRTLFTYILPYAEVGAFEAASKEVWRVEKSRMMSDEPSKFGSFWIIGSSAAAQVRPYAIVLHAALQAKERGVQGFTISMNFRDQFLYGAVHFGNRGDEGLPETMFIDADSVIAEISPLIPSPAALKARRQAQRS